MGDNKKDKADTMTNKNGDKKREREQNGDKTDIVTHKKADKKGDKRKQKGDIMETKGLRSETRMTNEQGDKKGDKADAATNKKGGQDRRQRETEGRQDTHTQ